MTAGFNRAIQLATSFPVITVLAVALIVSLYQMNEYADEVAKYERQLSTCQTLKSAAATCSESVVTLQNDCRAEVETALKSIKMPEPVERPAATAEEFNKWSRSKLK
ncbi:MAG: hypothetical protein Tp138OMZ00d2C19078241_35 [Prokaryotic dsDNA virus sp.]|jgi:hypothetical protein|nr:MAG: hypothetical protein Tp138OMZ00d2C19078241_35 [Prokaryotic dsDNA virus sp.]|tara:strand:- start:41231 stop:41551 length:321 start_codon:yes stop_codon:yes gene_type:complete